MRPVNKGDAPERQFTDYKQAGPYLEERIGTYCSYCEMPINHVPEIEHLVAKACGGSETDWENLLFSCKYCNSRKKTIIGDFSEDRWIWPHRHNTFLAFSYKDGKPRIREEYLKSFDETIYQKAKMMFEDLQLDHAPDLYVEKKRDRRNHERLNAFNRAKVSLKIWEESKVQNTMKQELLTNIVQLARATGFFSVWMDVFENEMEVRIALIEAFPGTCKACFDEQGRPVNRPGAEL